MVILIVSLKARIFLLSRAAAPLCHAISSCKNSFGQDSCLAEYRASVDA